MTARDYRVGWTENGVFFEPVTPGYAQQTSARDALDRIVGAFRRTRISEPTGWYFVLGPERTVSDFVGMGSERGKPFPKFKRMVET